MSNFWVNLDVFLSSAQEEFQAERKALAKRISHMPFLECVPLEERGATTVSALQASIQGVNECDIYIGIFGEQYSEVTIREYREAVTHRKLCLNYVKKSRKRDPRLDRFTENELKSQFKFHEFRGRKDLYTQIERDLNEHLFRLLRMGLAQVSRSKKQAFAAEKAMKPLLAKALAQDEEEMPFVMVEEAEKAMFENDLLGAVIKATVAIELSLRLVLSRIDASWKKKRLSLGMMLNHAYRINLLDAPSFNSTKELLHIRNAAVHEGRVPSRETALWVLKLSRELIETLRRIRS